MKGRPIAVLLGVPISKEMCMENNELLKSTFQYQTPHSSLSKMLVYINGHVLYTSQIDQILEDKKKKREQASTVTETRTRSHNHTDMTS